MAVSIRRLSGDQIKTYLDDLARLRIEVFRHFPYLYDGDMDYERKYLDTYARSPESLFVRVRRYPGKIRQINPKCLNLKGISGGVRYLALSTTIIGLTYDLGVKIQGLDLASQIQGVVAKAVDMGRAVRR